MQVIKTKPNYLELIITIIMFASVAVMRSSDLLKSMATQGDSDFANPIILILVVILMLYWRLPRKFVWLDERSVSVYRFDLFKKTTISINEIDEVQLDINETRIKSITGYETVINHKYITIEDIKTIEVYLNDKLDLLEEV